MFTKSMLADFSHALWGKASPSYKSLWHHMIDSGACAKALACGWRFKSAVHVVAETLGISEADTIQLIAYAAAIHDCYGKAHPAFQKKSRCDAEMFHQASLISQRDHEKGYRHERYGAAHYQETSSDLIHLPPLIANIIGSTIGLHHQGKVGHAEKPKLQRETWTAMANELHLKAIVLFQPPLEKLDHCAHCDACVVLLSAFVILADWIASSSAFDDVCAETDDAYFHLAQQIAEKAVVEYDLHSFEAFPQIDEYEQLWHFLSQDKLRETQRVVQKEAWPDADLTIIEAPMGEGKTEAGAFYAARLCSLRNKQGIYFALPTAATSNQMHGRIHQMLAQIQRNQPRLMHGMAWLVQKDQPIRWGDNEQESHGCDWLRPMRRAMLAESGVGTVDQAMMAALQIRYSCLRMLGLTGKALVIDEIHAYDAYMSSIIERLVQWCGVLRIPVIMLSATLTASKRRALVEAAGGQLSTMSHAYPLITQVKGGVSQQLEVNDTAKKGRFRFEPLRVWNQPDSIAEAALEKIAGGGCLCVMMNTVAEAQNVYQALKQKASASVQLFLFHARMKAGSRDNVEKRCVKLFGKDGSWRPDKAILVCTQVVEQSIDLDFDGMISCIAPIDLLLQRAGRVHRHERSQRPETMSEAVIHVLIPEVLYDKAYGQSGHVYHPWLLMQTQKLLPIAIDVPTGIRSAIEHVYAIPEDVSEEWASMMFSDELKAGQAKACELPSPDPYEFFGWNLSDGVFDLEEQDEAVSAKTRLSDPTIRVALLSDHQMEQAQVLWPSAAIAQEVLMNSFTMRASEQDAATYARGNGLLRDVVLISQNSLPVHIGSSIIHYDETLGAIIQRSERT